MELMAALLVLAILTSIAIPTYRDYEVRAKMIETITVINNLLDVAKAQYISAGTIPTSINGIPAGTTTVFTESPCIATVYYDDSATWANAGLGAMVQATLTAECGAGIPGFVAGAGGANNTVTVAFLASADSLYIYCGSWVDDGTQVPLSYLPQGCQNDGFQSQVTG